MSELRVIIITMGLSKIVEPIVSSSHSVIGVIECAPRGTHSWPLVKADQSSVAGRTDPDKTGRLRRYCMDRAIPYLYMDDRTQRDAADWVRGIAPDIIVIYSMSMLLHREVFSIPRYGAINLHPSLLPQYRGPNPWFWMFYHQEKFGGMTVHRLDDGEDSGDILCQQQFSISLGSRMEVVRERALEEVGVPLLLHALAHIDELPPVPQPKANQGRRARNVGLDEYRLLVEECELPVVGFWHFLRGTESLFNHAFTLPGAWPRRRWCVEGYQECDAGSYERARIYHENGRFFMAGRDGIVFLSRRTSLVRELKNLLDTAVRCIEKT